MKKTWMLDTNICSFIMREQPAAVLKRLEQAVLRGDRIVVSAVTYAEMRFGATG
ncbi:TPA: PIN domain-containing protein, partial [Klebsiella pneumoniae]|nr:PIN domain-containing protein [Citrobacter freundii]